jgi:hypothetical protein
MKTKTINLYNFSELSETAQQTAIENLYDINIDYKWFDYLIEDAKTVLLNITSFDIDRKEMKLNFIQNSINTSDKILQEHGEQTETNRLAKNFNIDYDLLVSKYSDGIDKTKVIYENETIFDSCISDLEIIFLNDLKNEYLLLFTKEYEYLTSKEAIIETIEANEYTFTIDGKLENL